MNDTIARPYSDFEALGITIDGAKVPVPPPWQVLRPTDDCYHQQYLAKNPNGYRCHSATGVPFPEGV